MEYCSADIKKQFLKTRSHFDESMYKQDENIGGLKDFAEYVYSLSFKDAPDYN